MIINTAKTKSRNTLPKYYTKIYKLFFFDKILAGFYCHTLNINFFFFLNILKNLGGTETSQLG